MEGSPVRPADPDRRTVLAATLALLAAPAAAAAPRSDRVAALIARMTIAEKAGQLSCFSDTIRPLGHAINPGEQARSADAMLREVAAGRVGMLFNGHGVAGAIRAQRAALSSRLGIPLAFAADVIHGYETIFPIPLADAAAFDPDLSERVARAIAGEASAGGLHWTFAPMVDVARDQRWGRVAEGAGEDVHLGRLLAAARVRGFQGGDLRRANTLAATPKHFAGYGAVRGGMEYAEVDISDATLRDVHLPPFAAAFAAGAASVMTSFTNVDGIPASANRALLTDTLRTMLGFRGPCVSDYRADLELLAHGIARDEADAARLAILAGIDMSMASGLFVKYLPALVASGAVPVERVDEAVGRVLALKERLGLFDDPFRSLDPAAERARIATPALRTLAREAATRAIVLLRNDGNLLPLPTGGRRIALIGPFVEDRDNLDGPWSYAGYRRTGVDLATGLRAALDDPGSLRVEPGSGIVDPIAGGLARAVAAAEAADVVLLAIGEGQDMSGEANSRTAITLPAAQQALADAVAATGRPIVILLRHGRALALDGAVAAAPAILATWFLGCETGHAVADILFGRVEPTARLPVSFPYATGQEPWSYDLPDTGRPPPPLPAEQGGTGRWRDAPDAARFAFGHGLSYTRFTLDALTAPADLHDRAEIAVTVRNVGARAGSEVVQLYVHPYVASRARPRWQLKAFRRVSLRPGEARRVTLILDAAELAFVRGDGRYATEPGTIALRVGTASAGPALFHDIDLVV